MISVSFAMFTAVWQYVANECRVATMQEEGGKRERESDREIQKVRVREEGSGLCSQYNTLTKQHLGWGLLECYISERSLEER